MKKASATILALFIVTFSAQAAAPVQASIPTYSWISPFYRGYDPFYQTSVTAYKSGSTAQLLVNIYNDWYGYSNITVVAVKVWFDWNVNYTSKETPYVMKLYESRSFTINFTVPSTDVASNMIPHRYIIYVEFSYDSYKNYWSYSPWEYFAVYSADQAEAQEFYQRLEAFRYMPLILSSNARALWFKAQMEFNDGNIAYGRGNFSNAKAHYQNAWNLYTQAINSEAERGAAFEDALINLMSSTAQSYEKLAELTDSLKEVMNSIADTSKMQANASLILSIGIFLGMLLIGIGVITYAFAKRKIAVTSATTSQP
jgi:tetratricopeptide (TPR) repeat protein